MERTVFIDGREVRMRASALIPRLYRHYFSRDMVRDMNTLITHYKKIESLPEDATDEERMEAQLKVVDLEIFENVAWLMIRHAGEEVPDNPDDWLESIEGIFSIYEVMPTVLELWNANQQTTSIPKNPAGQR